MKKFIIGLLVGAVVSFPFGINYGRGAPMLSNPFAAKLEQAKDKIEQVKEAVQEPPKKDR
jgi:hypothetical protein